MRVYANNGKLTYSNRLVPHESTSIQRDLEVGINVCKRISSIIPSGESRGRVYIGREKREQE